MLRDCTQCEGLGKVVSGRGWASEEGELVMCLECGGSGQVGSAFDSEPPSDAIGRAITSALDLASEDFYTRDTLPSPAPDDTLRCPASAPPVSE